MLAQDYYSLQTNTKCGGLCHCSTTPHLPKRAVHTSKTWDWQVLKTLFSQRLHLRNKQPDRSMWDIYGGFMRNKRKQKMWAAVWAAAGHSLFLVIKSFLVSLSVLYHYDFHWKIRAGDSGKLRGVPGSNWYAFSSLGTCQKRMDVISFLCNRTSQRQDRPQSDNRGGPGWEQLHLDTNHSQLEVDKHLQRGSGMWTGDHEGHQIQGKPTTAWNAQQTFLMSKVFNAVGV